MAVVFKARDRLLSRYVAIKILRPEYTKDRMFIESFRRESQIAAGLVHPNIVNVYDVGKEGNIYYIVMELIEGRALSDVIKEQGAAAMERGVAVCMDCRNNGYDFAKAAACVMAANGIKVRLFDELRPTPELSFAVRE